MTRLEGVTEDADFNNRIVAINIELLAKRLHKKYNSSCVPEQHLPEPSQNNNDKNYDLNGGYVSP